MATVGTGISVAFIVLLIFVLFAVMIPIAIGVYVYKDASKRGMNALMWTVIAALAPGAIGFIVYLIVRSNHSDMKCMNCGANVMPNFVVCPHCGSGLKPTCTNCGYPIEPGWAVCPGCGNPLDDENSGGVVYDAYAPSSDRGLKNIMICIIAVPIALVLVIAAVGMLVFGYNTNIEVTEAYVSVESYGTEIAETAMPDPYVTLNVYVDHSVEDVYSISVNCIEKGIILYSETSSNANFSEIKGENFIFQINTPSWSNNIFVVEFLDKNGKTVYETSEFSVISKAQLTLCYSDGEYFAYY